MTQTLEPGSEPELEREPEADVARHQRCATHGLRFDPQLHAGCVLCRRSVAAAGVATQQRTGFPVAALLSLCVCAGLFVHVLRGGRLLDPELRALLTGGAATSPASAGAALERARPPAPGNVAARSSTVAAEPQPAAAVVPSAEDICTRAARGDEAAPRDPQWPQTGLHGAAAHGDLARIVQESDLGFSRDIPDAQGRTPLAWAVLAGQRESVRVLLEEGANPNLAAADGDTPLMYAARAGHADVIKRLLAAGARVQATNKHGQTALMLAARHGRADAIATLAPDRAQLVMRCDRDMTALHHAAEGAGCTQVLPYLLSARDLLDARDGRGATAFLIAVGAGHAQFVRTLLERGVDPSARDASGMGAFDRLVAPRQAPSPAQLQALGEVFALLAASPADRRLMLDPAATPIWFRRELDALALREGRPPLPAYAPTARHAAAVAPGPVRPLRLLTAVGQRDSKTLPSWQPRDIVLRYRGWTRVPNIVQQVVVRGLSPRKDQQVRLSSDAQGVKPWTVRDVLLIQQMSGARGMASAFLGTVDDVLVGAQQVPRLGPPSASFDPDVLDFGPLLATDSGADRVVITILDFGGTAELSDVYLSIEGQLARETLSRVSVEAVPANGTAR